MKSTCLYIFSGLPASGKSTLGQALAKKVSAAYFRIDRIEQGLLDICKYKVHGGEGYELAHAVARDNLQIGISVVADSVNPWGLTRNAWNQVAQSCSVDFVNIEVICSNRDEHKSRAETRKSEIKNLRLPTWEEIMNREYHPWTEKHVLIDTAGLTESESCELLFTKIGSV